MGGKIMPKELTQVQLHKREIKSQIARLKFELHKTDYLALKHSEGWLTEEEYAPIKAHRQALREEINELQAELE